MKHSVTRHEIGRGAKGLLVNVPGVSVVSLELRFNSGYEFAERDHYEVPHVMEHVLATQTAKHSGPNEFMVEAQKNGAYVNAGTTARVNSYTYECAGFELDRILDLLEEQVTQPLFTPEKLQAELANVKEELTRNTTQHAAVCALNLAAKAQPWLWMEYEARLRQLSTITTGMMEQHFRRTHTAGNARFVLAGALADKDTVVKRLGRLFEQLPEGERLENNRAIGQKLDDPVVMDRDIAQLYYRVVRYLGEVSARERAAMILLRSLLVGGMGSRVLGEARERGLAYGVGGVGHIELGNSSFGFGGYVTPEHAEPLFELIGREFGEIANGGVRAAELEASKRLVVGSVLRATQTAGDLLGWYINPFDDSEQVRDFEVELEQIQTIRLDEVTALAKRVVNEGRFASSFVGRVGKSVDKAFIKALGTFAV
jgi:predicted Zn-dependent peptidase